MISISIVKNREVIKSTDFFLKRRNSKMKITSVEIYQMNIKLAYVLK